jgi:hypothetical protein
LVGPGGYLYLGGSGGVSTAFEVELGSAYYGLSSAGDVDADGYDDVITGDYTIDSNTGRARIYHGYADADGDGDPATTDCDDTDDTRSASAPEVCNGVDDDCDTLVDDDDGSAVDLSVFYTDADGDGYGARPPLLACDLPAGYATDAADCDDAAAAINPAAAETCNGVDDDCDTLVDDADSPVTGQSTFYVDADADGDGFATAIERCTLPPGYAVEDTASRYPPSLFERDAGLAPRRFVSGNIFGANPGAYVLNRGVGGDCFLNDFDVDSVRSPSP